MRKLKYVKLFENFNENEVDLSKLDKPSIKELNDKLKGMAIESFKKSGGHTIEISNEPTEMISNAPYNIVKTLMEYLCKYIKDKDMYCDFKIEDSLKSNGLIRGQRLTVTSTIISDCFKIKVYDDYDVHSKVNQNLPCTVFVNFEGEGQAGDMFKTSTLDLKTGKTIPGGNNTYGELCDLNDLNYDREVSGFTIREWNNELLERLISNIDASPF